MTTPTVVFATTAVLDPPALLAVLPSLNSGDVVYAVVLGSPDFRSPMWFPVAAHSDDDGNTVSVLRRTSPMVANPTTTTTLVTDTLESNLACVVLVVRDSAGRTHHVSASAFSGSVGSTPAGQKDATDLCLGFAACTDEGCDIYVPDDVAVHASAAGEANSCQLTVFGIQSVGETEVPSKTVRIGTATSGLAGYILIPGAR